MKHLPVGGSTAERTLKCPAWLDRAKRVPKPPSSGAANLGNLLHDAMETHYLTDKAFEDMVGKLSFADLVLDDDHIPALMSAKAMVDGVFDYYDVDEYLCEPFVEQEAGYIGGSVDIVWLSADGATLGILDYKFGRKKVRAAENKQLLFYAMCVAKDPKTRAMLAKVKNVVLTIVQPYCSSEADTWKCGVVDVQAFEAELMAALAEPTRSETGGHCFFCPVAATCPDKKAQAESALVLDPKDAKNAAAALELAEQLEPWLKQVRELTTNAAESGAVIPGWKLVEKNTQRRYTKNAQDVLAKTLGDDAFEKKLLPMGKVEKAMGRGAFAELNIVEKPEGSPELVREDDPREPLKIDVTKNIKDFVAKAKSN